MPQSASPNCSVCQVGRSSSPTGLRPPQKQLVEGDGESAKDDQGDRLIIVLLEAAQG